MRCWIWACVAITLCGCGGDPSTAAAPTDPCEGSACPDDVGRPDVGSPDEADTPSGDTPCVPDCEGLTCGSDGCGSVCGMCAEGAEICHESNCLLIPTVIISEIMADNDDTLQDEDGDTPDWVELQNRGEETVDLSGFYLTDNPENLDKWRFPSTEVAIGGVLLVFASGKDRAVSDAPLHTGFRLSSEGEYLALVMPDGETVVSEMAPGFPGQFEGVSYGTAQDIDTTVLVPHGAPIVWSVPTDERDGLAWTRSTFDHSAWSEGTTALGYHTGGPAPPDPDNDPNLALGKTTAQSSTLGSFGPELAVDGDLSNFTHTVRDDEDPTWDLDLGEAAWVTSVVLHNRAGCCQSRLRDITVSVLDESDNPVFVSALLNPENTDNNPARLSVDLFEEVGGVQGHKIRVHRQADPDLSGTNGEGNDDEATVLSLGEVEVFGAGDGLGAPIDTDIEAFMAGRNASVFLRIPFEVEDVGDIEQLNLRVLFDAGFVAFLNGERVAARQAPEALDWQSSATGEEPEVLQSVEVNLTPFVGALVSGTNILAIQGLNASAEDDDFYILPELVAMSVTDGGTRFFPEPTPGRVNDTEGILGYADVVFSHPHGFYDAPLELSITSSAPEARIRVTLDGSAPSETHGSLYEGPLLLEETSVVRAIAFQASYRTRPVRTATFLMVEDIVQQSAETTVSSGFPEMWGDTAPDYGLDQRVVDLHAETIRDDLRAIPSLSIAVEIDAMFGPEGIYTHSNRRGPQYEIPASAELILPDGQEGFEVNCGLKIQGGAFRSHGLTLKHSLRLIFSSDHGPTKLRYALFGPDASDRLDTITLRANSNDGWQWRGAGDKPLFVRDSFGRQTMLDMGNVASHETWVHLYINGVYWGLYNPVERPDASFSATYFGGEKEAWDSVSNNEASNGDKVAWDTMMALSNAGLEDNEDYLRIQGLGPDGSNDPELPAYVDVRNLADYMITNLYVGNTDWPQKNYWVGRDTSGAEGFKFYMWDSEWSLGLRSDLDTNRIGVDIGVAVPWAALIQNAEFRLLVADRAHQHFFHGALFVDPDNPGWDPQRPDLNRPAARFVALTEQIEAALVAESARWGDQHRDVPYTRDEHWRAERDALLSDYFPLRSQRVLEQFRQAGLYPPVAAPSFSQHGGEAAEGFELTLQAPEGVVLYTLDGSDPRRFGGQRAQDALEALGPVSLPSGQVVVKSRALVDGTWSALNEASFDVGL